MTIAAAGALVIGAAEEAALVVFLFAVGEVLEGVAAGVSVFHQQVADDTDAIRAQLHELFALGKPLQPRSRRHAWYLQRLADVDTRTQLDAAAVRALYEGDAQ